MSDVTWTTRNVLVFTGAGVSAPSGLATYRGRNGLWTVDPDLETAMDATRLPDVLPAIWAYSSRMRAAVLAAHPNPVHRAIVELAARCTDANATCTVVTQNVDGLHARAGQRTVIELHGNLLRSRCSRRRCGSGVWDDDTVVDPAAIPPCPRCGAPVRPDIVLFGEGLDRRRYDRAVRAAHAADLVVALGTSGTVYPARDILEHTRPGTRFVLVNGEPWQTPHHTAGTPFGYEVLGELADVGPSLLEAVTPAGAN